MQNTRTSVVKRKVDDRIKLLIDDVARNKHRGLFLVVGDRAKDQVVNLHSMVSHANHNAKVSVLWCMKDELDFGSTSRKRQEKRARQEVKGGLSTEVSKDAFQTFLAQTQIRFCKYEETHKILGQTFGMAILQDFEAITPNTLARTCETVKGGGMIVILFRGLHSLRQLCAIVMDVHSRYRTSRHVDVVPRFNERFLLSLMDCDVAMCVDDDLNVNAITTKMRDYDKKEQFKKIKNNKNRIEGTKASIMEEGEEGDEEKEEYDHELVVQGLLRHEQELASLQEKLHVSHEVGPLAKLCKTIDQVKTVLSLMQAIMEKTLDCTCVVTAARGRGKSAALGMAAAGALVQGYSNIFVTAPSPENVQTLFEFALRSLKEFGYVERVDFEALQGTSDEFSRCIIRINVFRGHRQSIQFISATDVSKFAQAELVIIDEAAALPLPLVKQMMGSYLVFLSSTISGYEGTGRSLSMKLIADMRKRSGEMHSGSNNSITSTNSNNRKLREMSLSDPIRYGPHDPVERWLNKLLYLEATSDSIPLRSSPHPQSCELYYVNRDALFSYHPLAESLLQRIQSLLAAAHYKNQPNDLQLLSDAPGHHLFVLCAKDLTTISTEQDKDDKNDNENAALSEIKMKQKKEVREEEIPDVYCVLHVCEEGGISAQTLRHQMSHGLRPSGDLIPYTLAQYFLEESFAKLYGMRIIRIATNPEIQHAGYGSRALQLLAEYYDGKVTLNRQTPQTEKEKEAAVEEEQHEQKSFQKEQGSKDKHKSKMSNALETDNNTRTTNNNGSTEENEGILHSRSSDPSLLIPITERPFEVIDYLGVSFGVTVELFNFWKRAYYDMVYLRQGANELTGEHSCVMVHPFGFSLQPLQVEFKRRFLHLLKTPFRKLPTELALSIVLDNSLYDPRKLAEAVSVINLQENEDEDDNDKTSIKTGKEVRVFNIPQADAHVISSVFSPNDLRRLQLFASSFVEGGNILDLVPSLAHLYFSHQLIKLANGQDGVVLSHAQAATVMAVGLQCINLEELSTQNTFSGVAVQQLRAFYHKAIVRLVEHVMKVMQLGSQNVKQKTNKVIGVNKNNNNTDKKESLDGKKPDKDDEVNKDEDAREIYDASGKLIGLSVAKRVHKKVSVDSTLLRDASNVVVSDASGSNDRDVQKSLQDVFYRPKKGTRRH